MNSSHETERSARGMFEDLARRQTPEWFEREKTPAEKDVIRGILDAMPMFVERYGGEPARALSEDNFHVIDDALPAEQRRAILDDSEGGLYDFRKQQLLILADRDSLLNTAQRMVHEALHFESFLSFTAQSESSPSSEQKHTLNLRRLGFSLFNNEQTKRFFREVDEAVIEELAIRFDEKHLESLPVLRAELELRSALAKKRGPENRHEVAAVIRRRMEDGRWKTTVHHWRYAAQRERLRRLVANLYKAHRDRFKTEEEVFAVFARAVFTGRILDLARLIEGTLGKRAFRALGESTMVGE